MSLALAALATEAAAKPQQTTRYDYYAIGGDTASDIYSAMLKKGPRVDGAKAYAATSATTTQDGKLVQAKSCQVKDYRLKLDFVIKLPRLANDKVLSGGERGRWKQFQAFLKKHEETHRSIWLSCAADLERQVKAIRAASCTEADRKATKLWEKVRAACNARHAALDNADQKRLMKHPFMQMVFRRSAVSNHAANAQ